MFPPLQSPVLSTCSLLVLTLTLSLAGCAASNSADLTAGLDDARAADSSELAPEAIAARGASDAPTIDKPPTFPPGYKLTFNSRKSTFDVTFEGDQNGLLTFFFDTREKMPFRYHYTPDLKLAEITNAQDHIQFSPPVGYVDFPLYVGKSWSVAYRATAKSRQSMGQTDVEVLGYEPVETPYGTLDAFKIRVRTTNRQIKRMNPYETYWYSPEIGYYVKHETNRPVYEDPYELIAVSR
jgi:hypothetical protein